MGSTISDKVLQCSLNELSCICLKAALTYAEAQMRIDDPSMQDKVTLSLRGLNKLAKLLKRRRIENGYVPSTVNIALKQLE